MADIRRLLSEGARLPMLMHRTLIHTLGAMLIVGFFLGLLLGGLLGSGNMLRATTTGLLVFVLWGIAGYLLAVRQAVLRGSLVGIEESHVVRAVLDAIFEQLLGIDEGEQMGARGGLVARSLERLPLKDAEQRLTRVIVRLQPPAERDPTPGAWLRRHLHRHLLRVVQAITASRLREASSAASGVDLVLVRNELELYLEAAITARTHTAILLTAVIYGLACFGVSVVTAIALRLLWPA